LYRLDRLVAPASAAAPSKIRGRAEFALYLRVSTASNPSSINCHRVRRILAMLVSSASAIRLSLQPSPASDMSAFSLSQQLSGTLAFVDQVVESWAFVSTQPTYLLTATSFAVTNYLFRWRARQ
jgi:hypothetical protein